MDEHNPEDGPPEKPPPKGPNKGGDKMAKEDLEAQLNDLFAQELKKNPPKKKPRPQNQPPMN